MSKKDNLLESADYSNSLNSIIYKEVTNGSTCLDVGCWIGNLGHSLITNKSCIVDGIDFRTDKLEVAKNRGYRNTYTKDLNHPELNFSDITNKYDYIIFADVLEHLVNPEYVLTELSKKLNKKGRVLISVPNVAFLLNRIRLLFGKWDYTQFGTLDKTHLKFYTLKSAKKLAHNAGLSKAKVIAYNQFGFIAKLPFLAKYFPGLLGYQIMVKVQRG